MRNTPLTIIPAVLTESLAQAAEQLDLARELEGVERLHFDVIDAHFGDFLTLTPADAAELDWGDIQVDLHLMVEEPVDYVIEASLIDPKLPIHTVLGQVERMSYQDEFVAEVKKHGWKAGLSLNVYTPLEAVDEEIWQRLDAIQIMGVPAGAQNQSFHPSSLGVLRELSELMAKQPELQELEVIIDGGVRHHLVDELCAHGVSSLVVGSSLWNQADPEQSYEAYLDLVAACRRTTERAT